MLKKTIALLICSSFFGGVALSAEPAPSSKKKPAQKTKKETAATTPVKALPESWSLVNGVWVHPHGYKFVRGQVVRLGIQTHKSAPKPPTQAEMDAVTKRNRPPQTAAEIAAAKAAERERNLRPRPASQTGSNL
jgi:hypothetical protein